MKVLIVGGGGREHALAWKAAQSPLVSGVLVAPGNAGTARERGVRNVAIDSADIEALAALAAEESVALTIVGPEQPLVDGIVDAFEARGLACFGPRKACARLEGSKGYAKDFLERHGIPTARYARFTELDAALEYLRGHAMPAVIKADGLAAGKGVVVAETRGEAERAAMSMLGEHVFGEAGREIVVEEFLTGEETSFIAIVDGTDIVPLATSQDHKRRDDGDSGPNTGGMGAYSPAPIVTPALHERIMNEVMLPTIRGLAAQGTPYRGFLYAGLMIDASGTPRVLEFNCRFGDPETQPILFRLRSDLVELCLASMAGTLAGRHAEWDPRAAVGVVMASAGYPGSYERGKVIRGLDRLDNLDGLDGLDGLDRETFKVFHAGTRLDGERVVTDGGRVLCAVALGADVAAARERAYRGVDAIVWEGAFYRRDIAHRALTRSAATTSPSS